MTRMMRKSLNSQPLLHLLFHHLFFRSCLLLLLTPQRVTSITQALSALMNLITSPLTVTLLAVPFRVQARNLVMASILLHFGVRSANEVFHNISKILLWTSCVPGMWHCSSVYVPPFQNFLQGAVVICSPVTVKCYSHHFGLFWHVCNCGLYMYLYIIIFDSV